MKKISQYKKDQKKNFIKNSFWMGSRQTLIVLMGIALSAVFARLTTKETYGQYQLVLSIFATISIISISGLNAATLQAVANGFDGVYKKAFKIRFKWSLLGIPILLLIGVNYLIKNQTDLGCVILLSSIFFPLLYSTNIWESLIQGKERFDILAKNSIFRSALTTSILIFVLILFKNNIFLLLPAYFGSIVVCNCFFFQKSKKLITHKKEDPDSIKYGWFLTKMSLLNSLLSRADYLIIGYFLGIENLANYSIGMSIGIKIKDSFKTISLIFIPKISRKGFREIKNYIFIFLLSSIIATVVFFSLPFIITLLFSDKYQESAQIAQTFILFLPFFMTGLFLENHLSFFSKNKKIIFFVNIFAPLLKLLLMIFLIKIMSEQGLVVANGLYPVIKILFILIGFKCLNKKSSF